MDTAREMFARIFRRYRNAVGSVTEAARIAGYSHSHISQIEHGKCVPTPDAADVFDQTFGARGVIVDAARLLREADREAASSIEADNDCVDSVDVREMGDVSGGSCCNGRSALSVPLAWRSTHLGTWTRCG